MKRPATVAWFLLDDPVLGVIEDIVPNSDLPVRFERPDPGVPAGGYTIVSRSSAFQRYGARAPGATASGVVQHLPENPVVAAAGGSRWFSPVLWAATDDGAVATEDGAWWWGDLWELNVTPSHPIVGMAVLPDASGYWLVARDGGIFAFGDAEFHGSGAAPGRTDVIGLVTA